MSGGRVERRLAAILAVDVAGYSRLMREDEEGTLAALRALRRELGDPKITEHRGRIVKTTGDGLLAEFASVVDAVRCAVDVQREMAARNVSVPAERRIEFRIGINLGDIIIEEGDIFGDGVNIAARLEALAEPGGICLSAAAHEQVRDKLDFSFEDMGDQQVKNIARPVRTHRIVIAWNARPIAASAAAATTLPEKPSIAVLPFQNMSRDPEQEYFADGMVEDIITGLSRIRWLFVLARNSSFTYKGQAIDLKRVGRELGVRYVLEGSVRKAGQRLRITAQLIDAASGAHLWADRFDGALEDVFDLQDKVTSSVVGVIEPALQAAETARSASRPTTDLTAYDLYLRAYDILWSAARNVPQALQLMEQAIARDPHYGPALAWAALCCYRLLLDDRSKDPRADLEKGIDFARRALEVARDDPAILTNAAIVLASFGEDIDAMMALVDRALAINPNYARGWHISGTLRLYAGQLDTAIEHLQASLRLSPRAPIGASLLILGSAYLATRQFDEAARNLRLALEEDPSFPMTYRVLASCYAHMGRLDEAREMVTRLRSLTSVIMPDARFIRNPEQRELWLSGLRIAAGEQA
jgi:TolB-like protein/class 3 adenylate cyclase/Tfp pilus assembly protein PilF